MDFSEFSLWNTTAMKWFKTHDNAFNNDSLVITYNLSGVNKQVHISWLYTCLWNQYVLKMWKYEL